MDRRARPTGHLSKCVQVRKAAPVGTMPTEGGPLFKSGNKRSSMINSRNRSSAASAESYIPYQAYRMSDIDGDGLLPPQIRYVMRIV